MLVGEIGDTAFETYVSVPDGCNNVRRIALYRAHPGPHYWRSTWEGLTQTRPALLPYAGALREWVPKSRRPGVPESHMKELLRALKHSDISSTSAGGNLGHDDEKEEKVMK